MCFEKYLWWLYPKHGTPINNYVILFYAPFSPTALFVIIIIITDLILFMINCNERILTDIIRMCVLYMIKTKKGQCAYVQRVALSLHAIIIYWSEFFRITFHAITYIFLCGILVYFFFYCLLFMWNCWINNPIFFYYK